jgi:hypothetical protein
VDRALGTRPGALADLGFLGLDDDPDDPVVVTGVKATRAPVEQHDHPERPSRHHPDQLLQEGVLERGTAPSCQR